MLLMLEWFTERTFARDLDAAHVAAAAELRTAFKDRCAATRGPVTATDVGLRELSDYDEMFALPVPAPRPNLQVVR